ncbi:NAD kinase 2, mitochondrial isoform X1 [Bactrocera oleae]|uniref:NAD kinase 2, mitochondrial isoform X1 n=2 Tax=Bactrocera oleae TaxID=104688 RepID=UPI0006B873E0|nr:NAD kinase 2, mitochondrial isoform X1 [Bactrocera oleae]XP_036223698.1 NAD kinase 2, mitochondrial isoform X1 [Bactrocera oleae]XP_036223699.1 NAD kinase 2, mitochondrial isoform X1 [Bactrocera oleae]
MLKSKTLTRQIAKEYRMWRKISSHNKGCGSMAKYPSTQFKLQRALIITKFSRYEFEQMRNPQLSRVQLEKKLRDRGTDFEMLMYLHNLHKDFERNVVQSFLNVGCEVKVANRVEFRSSLSKEIMKWADLIVPVGGDGTFLLAAGRASPLFAQSQQKTPIVGFNSDPQRSEGRLMLPKHYTENTADAVTKIKSGDFQWMYRTRIRTSILGSNGKIPESTDLYRHTVTKMEQEKTEPEYLSKAWSLRYKAKMKRVLPYLALNEVFIGEQLSARVSHLQLVINHENIDNKTKCSGLCVSTGTGSTSWHTSINRITSQQVEDLLSILPIPDSGCDKPKPVFDSDEIATQYNQNLRFGPDDPRLCYSIREQICVGVWPSPRNFKARKFVNSLFVKSRCIDANLVIDGSISYPFNDGAKALLEVYPEDSLLTIFLD